MYFVMKNYGDVERFYDFVLKVSFFQLSIFNILWFDFDGCNGFLLNNLDFYQGVCKLVGREVEELVFVVFEVKFFWFIIFQLIS